MEVDLKSKVRYLSKEEISLCIDGGRKFYEEGNLPGQFNEESFINIWNRLYDTNTGFILGAFGDNNIIGAIGGVLHPDINTRDLTCMEMFWYVIREYRKTGIGIDLFNEFESKCKDLKVKRMIMVHVKGLMEDELKLLYESIGYRQTETHYAKEI